MKLHLRKGDKVMVIAGNHKGESGEVTQVLVDKQRAIVSGVNMQSRHSKPTSENPQGGIVKKEGSIHVSNLMVINPDNGKPARTGYTTDNKGNKTRFFKTKK
ncbi:MAG: 50S ribosomal protein L24 [Bacteroidia bacterium]|jgi:large subunit ribosomal protein L24